MEGTHEAFSKIADYAQALREVLNSTLEGTPEQVLCELTLTKIIELADQFV